jgi:hypothetical protein
MDLHCQHYLHAHMSAAPAMTNRRRPGNRIIPGYFGRLGLRRRGRNQLRVWRAIIANEGRIMTTKQILQCVFPGRAPRRQWLSVREAAARYMVRVSPRSRPLRWRLKDDIEL